MLVSQVLPLMYAVSCMLRWFQPYMATTSSFSCAPVQSGRANGEIIQRNSEIASDNLIFTLLNLINWFRYRSGTLLNAFSTVRYVS